MILQTKILQLALDLAQKAYDMDEVPVGAVIFNTKTGDILAFAHNETQLRQNPLKHAEIIAIENACTLLNSKNLSGYSLFVTLEPCSMCASAISLSRLDALYFGAKDEKTGGVYQGAKIYTHTQTHHKPQIYSGFNEQECAILLKNFFKMKRQKK